MWIDFDKWEVWSEEQNNNSLYWKWLLMQSLNVSEISYVEFGQMADTC